MLYVHVYLHPKIDIAEHGISYLGDSMPISSSLAPVRALFCLPTLSDSLPPPVRPSPLLLTGDNRNYCSPAHLEGADIGKEPGLQNLQFWQKF